VPDDAKLNTIIRKTKQKLGERANIEAPGATKIGRIGEVRVKNLALTSAVLALNRMHKSQEADRSKKEAESTLFRTMSPPQKKLFTDLCTSNIEVRPEVTEFMNPSLGPKQHRKLCL
jgi:hypothetical protein